MNPCLHVSIFMQVFSIFEDLGISVDVVATSEVSISLTLDPSKLWSRELIQQVSHYSRSVFCCVPFLPSIILLTIYCEVKFFVYILKFRKTILSWEQIFYSKKHDLAGT
jgi:hypothetical protein